MATITKNLGPATAYGYAKEHGYTGTEEQYAELMASYATVAEQAAASASAAAGSADTASTKATAAANSATAASNSATTATTKAGEAATSATNAANSANTANTKAGEAASSATAASGSASTASTKAGEASASATAAAGSATDANTAKVAAQAAQTAAEQAAESVSGLSAQITQNTADIADLVDNKAGALIDSASGSIVSVYPDKTVPNVYGLTADVDPVQDLHGYNAPWPAGGGKNILPVSTKPSATGSVSFTNNNDGSWVVDGSSGGSNTYAPGSTKCISLGVLSAGNYVASLQHTDGQLSSILAIRIGKGSESTFLESGIGSCTFTADGTSEYWFTFMLPTNKTTSNELVWLQVEAGSSVTSYAPYSNICPISGRTGANVYVSPTENVADATTYAVDWTSEAGTVYGGTVDIVSGVLTVDRANIPSYNGETITEPWLSSIDAYAAGTTPTIGAQVVYTLATPLTYQLTPQEVSTIVGLNNILADTGDVSVEYAADLKHYIDSKIAAAVAAMS